MARAEYQIQDDGKGGLGLRGVAFMTVLAVLTVTLPSFCLSYKLQYQEDDRDGFDGFGGFGGCGGFGRDSDPCDPPFPLQTPQTPENSKTQKSYSKVSFGLPAKVTQKLPKSDSKVTFWTVFRHF